MESLVTFGRKEGLKKIRISAKDLGSNLEPCWKKEEVLLMGTSAWLKVFDNTSNNDNDNIVIHS